MKKHAFQFDRRASGLLIHPTSLPGPYYHGDIGDAAYAFVDFLKAAKCKWWQMLPVSPPGGPPGNSPYSSTSAFAGSPWLISLDSLQRQGLLEKREIKPPGAKNDAPANYVKSMAYRLPRLKQAFERFKARGWTRKGAFVGFVDANQSWLADYVLFGALKDKTAGASWTAWDRNLRLREPAALRAARSELAETIEFHTFIQYEFDRQWMALKLHAARSGVGLIGDIPIFVAHDSADVWAQRHLFLLDANGNTRTKSGYPPDFFNVDGQTWGHPHYDWAVHHRERYSWWVSRFAATHRWFDAVRIDHFLGFHRAWHIPGKADNARRGKWVVGPREAIFEALRVGLGETPIIAEDLGQLTPEASALRDRFSFPGMRVIQFGFGDEDYHLPHTYVRRSVAYTGTHDNGTICAWFNTLKKAAKTKPAARAELKKAMTYLPSDGREVHWDMARCLLSSIADTIIFPVQDILGLDDDARMNTPGIAEGNWLWRLEEGALNNATADRLAQLNTLYGRAPQQKRNFAS